MPLVLAALALTRTLVFLATSDQHGQLEAAARLGYAISEERARAPGRVVLLDGGDLFQGTLASNLHEGAAMVHALNAMRYQAAAVGNHEFDFGPVGPHGTPQRADENPRGALFARAAEAHFPLLSANVLDARTGRPIFRPYVVITVAGVKIGVVGGTAADTPHTTNPRNLVGLRVAPLAPAIAAAAKEARAAGATVVVALVHEGADCPRRAGTILTDRAPGNLFGCHDRAPSFRLARALAQEGPGGRIDAIFGGHTHRGVTAVVAGIPVVQAYSKGRAYSKVELEVDARGRPTGHFVVYAPIRVAKRAPSDPAVERAIAADLAEVARLRARSLGVSLPSRLRRGYRAESALGNFVADEIRAFTQTDVALTNGGGLRADLPPGPLTYGALFEALPFGNRLATLTLTGEQLARLLARNLSRGHGILSLSGLRAKARCVGKKLTVELYRGDDAPVAATTRLRVGTTDFLAAGGDDFAPLVRKQAPTFLPSEPIHDLVAADLVRRAAVGQRQLRDRDYFDPAHPRLELPSPPPVRCQSHLTGE